ncbi:transporter substrate-binding domain-containing protein [Brachybacterium phenoliresistens]|uniref:Amino acid ABC transporter amino acid-binding protein n=1 Tax=Brachybacterium phenoliresistens TaxID=396014 RepID=Z9JVQ0_9MICO|nr:transporter substrate-binding domain-containing protein [Brachybacterium phenoliresistens]EWS81862.1 amino acid ABC transporter amino acid-binding protein [Brachybacterium phenoliresistens]
MTSLSRRTTLVAASGTGLAALLAACGPAQNRSEDGSVVSDGGSSAAEDTLARIRSSGTVRIGLEGTYKPYAFHDASGALVGFEKDIADAVAKGLGAEPEYIETEWDSLIAGLDVDKYDLVINNVGITPERQEKYLFTEPYARSIGRVAVPESSSAQAIADLEGKRAAQTATSNWAEQMTGLGLEIVPVQGFAEAIELVVQERVDATANDLVSFQSYLDEHPDAAFRLLDEELPTETVVGVIMPKGQEALLAEVDEILAGMKADGSLAGIYQEWVGQDLSPQE